MGMINELYHGDICPLENFGYSKDQIYTDLVEDTQRIENKLLSGLSEEEKQLYQTVKDSRTELGNMEIERMFEVAFKMGFRFGVELFQE